MTKLEYYSELVMRLKVLRAEAEGIYFELETSKLHTAENELALSIRPISSAIQSVECEIKMAEAEQDPTKRTEELYAEIQEEN